MNVVIDDRRRPLKFVAGDMEQAFLEGCGFVRDVVTDTVPEPVDIVVTSSAGYPLGHDLLPVGQGHGRRAADRQGRAGRSSWRPACREGIGSPHFQSLFRAHPTLDDFMEQDPGTKITSSWTNGSWRSWPRCAARRGVKVVSDGLPAETLNGLFVESAPSVEAAVAEALREYGPDARIAVIPKGPYVVAKVAGS